MPSPHAQHQALVPCSIPLHPSLRCCPAWAMPRCCMNGLGGDKASSLRAGRQRGGGRRRGSHQRSCQDFLSPLGPIRDIISKLINRLQMLSQRQGVFLRSSVEHPDKVLGWESCQRTPVFLFVLCPWPPSPLITSLLPGFFGGKGRKKSGSGLRSSLLAHQDAAGRRNASSRATGSAAADTGLVFHQKCESPLPRRGPYLLKCLLTFSISCC